MKTYKRFVTIFLVFIGVIPIQALALQYSVTMPKEDQNYSEVIPEGQSPKGTTIYLRIENKHDAATLLCEYQIWKKGVQGNDLSTENEKAATGKLNVLYVGGAFTNHPNMYWHYGKKPIKLLKRGDYTLYTRCYVIPEMTGNWSDSMWTPNWSSWKSREFHIVHIPTTSKEPEVGQVNDTPMMTGPGTSNKKASIAKEPVKVPIPSPPVQFGSKTGAASAAVAPTPRPQTSYVEPFTLTQPVIQPMQDMSRPISGPTPGLQTQPITRAPAIAAPLPMTGTRVDPALQKAPVQVDLQPQVPRQVTRIPQPVISYPTPNMVFTAPASIAAKARLVSGKRHFYGLKQQGLTRDIARNGNGRFANLNAGKYCVYVAYDPAGPASSCVPFSVSLAVKRAPALQTTPPKPVVQPAPIIAPKPVSPAPMRKTQPTPMTPGG